MVVSFLRQFSWVYHEVLTLNYLIFHGLVKNYVEN